MESITFLAIMACLSAVAVWYMQNDIADSAAGFGLFAIRPDGDDGDATQLCDDEQGLRKARYGVRQPRAVRAAAMTLSERVRTTAADILQEEHRAARYKTRPERGAAQAALRSGGRYVTRADALRFRAAPKRPSTGEERANMRDMR